MYICQVTIRRITFGLWKTHTQILELALALWAGLMPAFPPHLQGAVPIRRACGRGPSLSHRAGRLGLRQAGRSPLAWMPSRGLSRSARNLRAVWGPVLRPPLFASSGTGTILVAARGRLMKPAPFAVRALRAVSTLPQRAEATEPAEPNAGASASPSRSPKARPVRHRPLIAPAVRPRSARGRHWLQAATVHTPTSMANTPVQAVAGSAPELRLYSARFPHPPARHPRRAYPARPR